MGSFSCTWFSVACSDTLVYLIPDTRPALPIGKVGQLPQGVGGCLAVPPSVEGQVLHNPWGSPKQASYLGWSGRCYSITSVEVIQASNCLPSQLLYMEKGWWRCHFVLPLMQQNVLGQPYLIYPGSNSEIRSEIMRLDCKMLWKYNTIRMPDHNKPAVI